MCAAKNLSFPPPLGGPFVSLAFNGPKADAVEGVNGQACKVLTAATVVYADAVLLSAIKDLEYLIPSQV